MIKEDDSSIEAHVSPRVEKSYLVERVEPEFREAANSRIFRGPWY